jgi:hypothetical protein
MLLAATRSVLVLDTTSTVIAQSAPATYTSTQTVINSQADSGPSLASVASSIGKNFVRGWSMTVGLTNLVEPSCSVDSYGQRRCYINSLASPTPLSTTGTSPPIVSSSSTNDSNSGGDEGNTNIGAIAGGVVGGLAVIGMVVIALYWIRRRHPKQKVTEAHLEEPKTNDAGDAYAHAIPVAELDSGREHATSDLDAISNQINELPAGKK